MCFKNRVENTLVDWENVCWYIYVTFQAQLRRLYVCSIIILIPKRLILFFQNLIVQSICPRVVVE